MPRPARIALVVAALLTAGCSDSSGPEGALGCEAVIRHTIGETVTGSIRTTDCGSPDDEGYIDLYQFRQAASGPVSVMLDVPGSSVTMGIVLFDTDENVIDFGRVEPGEQFAVGGTLDEGTYFIVIIAASPGAQSTYSFNSARSIRFTGPPFLNCTVAQTYTFGATVNGTLGTGDCVTPDGAYIDRHQFTLATARTVTITMTSDEVDSFLYLFDAQGAMLARNDDQGIETFDSRISVSLPAGTYAIGASAYDQFEAGAYTLRTQ